MTFGRKDMRALRRLLIGSSVLLLSLVSAAYAQEPIKIGVLGDLAGPFAAMSGKGSIVAAQMAIDEVGGSVLGRKVEILTGDSQNKPDVGAAIVRRWFEN